MDLLLSTNPRVEVLYYNTLQTGKDNNNYKTSFSRVSNAISKPSSKIVGSKIVKKNRRGSKYETIPCYLNSVTLIYTKYKLFKNACDLSALFFSV